MGIWQNNSVMVGWSAAFRSIKNDDVVAIGAGAMKGAYSAEKSVFIGAEAGAEIPQTVLPDNETYNVSRAVVIGSQAAMRATGITGAIIIGYRAGDLAAGLNLNGKLFIGYGSSSDTIPTIGGDVGARTVTINRAINNATLARFHVNEGTPNGGAAPNVSGRIAVFESDTTGGITILTPASATGNLFFADPDDNNVGRIQYNHANNTMAFAVNDTTKMTLKSNTLNIVGLPTSASGLVAGDLWNDGGTVKVV
jgi:hypothetical protein